MKSHLLLLLVLLLSCFFSFHAEAQCTGDNIIRYVNSDLTIQKAVRKSFKIKKHQPTVINADTSFNRLHSRVSSFKDSLIKNGFPKHIFDSLDNVYRRAPDSLLTPGPVFCGKQFISDETNYNEHKNNLVLMASQLNDSLVIGEIIYCTGEYVGRGTLRQPEFIMILFFLGAKGDVEHAIILPTKSYPDAPVFR